MSATVFSSPFSFLTSLLNPDGFHKLILIGVGSIVNPNLKLCAIAIFSYGVYSDDPVPFLADGAIFQIDWQWVEETIFGLPLGCSPGDKNHE